MILNLVELVVEFLILVVSDLLNQLILLVNQGAHLALLRGIVSILSQLLTQFFDCLIELLDLISVLLILLLQI